MTFLKKFWSVQLIVLTETGYGQNVFQCQFSSGRIFTPNIPDLYFNSQNVAEFLNIHESNLTKLRTGFTYIFTIPNKPCTCSGTVVAVQYCYENATQSQNIFSFQSVTQEVVGMYTVNTEFTIPQENCTRRVCCDNTTLDIQNHIHIPCSSYTFGITSEHLLAFSNAALEYKVEQFQLALSGAMSFTQPFSIEIAGVPLLRLFLGNNIATHFSCILSSYITT